MFPALGFRGCYGYLADQPYSNQPYGYLYGPNAETYFICGICVSQVPFVAGIDNGCLCNGDPGEDNKEDADSDPCHTYYCT